MITASFKGFVNISAGSRDSLNIPKYNLIGPSSVTQYSIASINSASHTSSILSNRISFASLCDDPMLRIFDTFSEDDFETEIESEDEGDTRVVRSPEFIYREACEDLKVTPISYYIRHINDSHLNLNYRCMGPKSIEAVAVSLVGSTAVTTLELEDNWIEAEGLKYLMEMLTENCYIQELNLSRNNLQTKGAAIFAKMLPQNISLRSINLSRNRFRDNDAEYFADAFASNFRVTHLDLSNNEFGEKGGEELGQLIAYSESLVILDISWNQIQLKGAMAISAGLRLNMMLKVLNLSNNGFGNEGALALGEALRHNSYLHELDLKNNHIGMEGVTMLCRGLEVNDTLRVLDLSDNPLRLEAAFTLLAVLKKNPKTLMRWFGLSNVIVNEAFMEQLRIMKDERQNLMFITAGLGGAFTKKRKYRLSPILVIQQFLKQRKLRLIDFFQSMDKDKTMKVSVSDFRKALQKYEIPLDRVQIEELLMRFDRDNVGEVDYRTLVDTRKQMVEEQRREQRKMESQQREEQSKSQHLLNSFRGAVEAVRPVSSSIISSSHRLPSLLPQDSPPSSSDALLGSWGRPEGADSSQYSLPTLSRERVHRPLSVPHPSSLSPLPSVPRKRFVSQSHLILDPNHGFAHHPSTTSNLVGKPKPPTASRQLKASSGQYKPQRETERERQ